MSKLLSIIIAGFLVILLFFLRSESENVSGKGEYQDPVSAKQKFWIENQAEPPEIPKSSKNPNDPKSLNDPKLRLMTYNIHYFRNINPEISEPDNIKNIIRLINRSEADIVVLQEVDWNLFAPEIKNLNYKHHIKTDNGSPVGTQKNKMQLVVLSKKRYPFRILDSTPEPEFQKIHDRNQILLETEFGRILCIHMEIGIPVSPDLDQEQKTRNSEYRIRSLEKLLTSGAPDIILGDFNFQSEDPEFRFLSREYQTKSDLKIQTTPFNRVDFVFLKKNKYNSKTVQEYIIKCNYSDHLPVLLDISRRV